MINYKFKQVWLTKTKQILQNPEISEAEKILAYKVFMRPLLMYNWFNRHIGSLKAMEVSVLRQVFGPMNISNLYKRYTDIDVAGYIKIEDIRWYRTSHSTRSVVRKALDALSKTAADPTPYFVRAADRLKYHRRNESSKAKCLSSKLVLKENARPDSTETVIRRSRRLAIKDTDSQNNKPTAPSV
ncbi:unnamed protein product [Arctia plantaginis]|uniref:Uncharacterized protein n=1 Tax=Arctia plantaginis TaxID=874455 RepID=A0A8S0Z2P7_ARCPL|nr:unnamed protein product [Arctia plantaginis]